MGLIVKRPMKKSYKVLVQENRLVNINKKQADLFKNAKKVRKGESKQAWENRVRKFNLMKECDIQKILNSKSFNIYFKHRIRVKDELKKKKAIQEIHFQRANIPYDFLSYFGIVKNYFCIKYAINKVDFDICLAFYNNKIIELNSFNNICILNHGSSTSFLKRFIDRGYIVEILQNTLKENLDKKFKKTGIYKISYNMSNIFREFYLILAKQNSLKDTKYKGMYNKEQEIEFEKMNTEINEYITMDKKQLNINQ